MLNHWWYEPIPNPVEYWMNWLVDRATYSACMCAMYIQDDPTFAVHMSNQFELFEERAWLLTVHTTEIVKVIEC